MTFRFLIWTILISCCCMNVHGGKESLNEALKELTRLTSQLDVRDAKTRWAQIQKALTAHKYMLKAPDILDTMMQNLNVLETKIKEELAKLEQ